MRASAVDFPVAQRRGATRRWAEALLLALLAVQWALVYLPRLTLLPPIYIDDFDLLAPPMHWAQTGHLTSRTVDSPLPDSGPLFQEAPTPTTLESGWFFLMGLLARLGLLDHTTARLMSGLALLGLTWLVALLSSRVSHWGVGLVAGMLTLLDPNIWYGGRVVLSDYLTACAGLTGVWLAWKGAHDERPGLLVAGSALVGWTPSLHPTAMIYGISFALLVWAPLLVRRRWPALLLATVACGVPLGFFAGHLLGHHEVLTTLLAKKKATVAGSGEGTAATLPLLANVRAEVRRYTTAYASPYTVANEVFHQGAYLLGACGWLIGGGVLARRGWRAGRRWPSGLRGSAAVVWLVAALVLLLTPPAHKWGYYLVHLAPLYYVMTAYICVDWLPRQLFADKPIDLRTAPLWYRERIAPWLPPRSLAYVRGLFTVCAVLWFGIRGLAYPRWYGEFERDWRYGHVTESLAPHVPAASVLAGSPPIHAIAWASGAAYLNDQTVIHGEVEFPRFPWQPTRGPFQYPYSYETDPAALAAVAELLPGGLFLGVDDALLMHNAYAPFGVQHGQAIAEWQAALDRYFAPVAEHYGAQQGRVAFHGRTAIYRYVGEQGSAPWPEPVRYWEGRRIALGPPLPGLGSVQEVARSQGQPLNADGSLAVSGGPGPDNIWTLQLPVPWGDYPAVHVEFEVSVTGGRDSRFVWIAFGQRQASPWYGHPQRLRHHLLILPPEVQGMPVFLAFQAPTRPSTGRLWAIRVCPVTVLRAREPTAS